jgi:hypothetical protein
MRMPGHYSIRYHRETAVADGLLTLGWDVKAKRARLNSHLSATRSNSDAFGPMISVILTNVVADSGLHTMEQAGKGMGAKE